MTHSDDAVREPDLDHDVETGYVNGHDIEREETNGHRIYQCQDCDMVFVSDFGLRNRRFCPI